MLIHSQIVQEIQRERQETARRERLRVELRAHKPPRRRPLLSYFLRRSVTPRTAPQSR
jgi:hypothetical protein